MINMEEDNGLQDNAQNRGEESTSSVDSAEHAPMIDPFLMECPICLEQLNQPKSLPCLHTFCLNCLTDCILKDDNLTTFSCPICRTITSPLDSSLDKGMWALNFPTNNLIVEMLKYTQQIKTAKVCDPCTRKEGKEVVPVKWCPICNVYLCKECEKSFHRFLHPSDLSSDVSNQNTCARYGIKCERHQKQMRLFCVDHQILVCSLCVSVAHRSCDNVLTSMEYVKMITGDNERNITTCLTEGEKVLDVLLEDIGLQIEQLEGDKCQAEHKIQDQRQMIEYYVNTLQKQAMDDLTKVYKNRKELLQTLLQKCRSLKNSMSNTGKISRVLSEGNDSTRQISIYQRAKAETSSCKRLVQELIQPQETIEYKCDNSVYENVCLISKLGHVSVTNKFRDLPDSVDSWLTFSGRKVIEDTKFSAKIDSDDNECSIRSVQWIRKDLLLVTDISNKNVKLFKATGTFIDALKFADRPWDFCKLIGDRIAITRPDAKRISIVKLQEDVSDKEDMDRNIKTNQDATEGNCFPNSCEGSIDRIGSCSDKSSKQMKLILEADEDIEIGIMCYGICHIDGKFIVSNGKQSPYRIYSVSGNGQTEVVMEHESPCYYVTGALNQKDVLVSLTTSIQGNAAVYKLSDENHVTRTNVATTDQTMLQNTHGLCTDGEGNVYVCCTGLPGIVQISSDCCTIKELAIAEQGGLKDPRAIALMKDKLAIADVAKDNANVVKIFRLR